MQGVHRPPVQATVECDIGFKRSTDGCARTPSRDWSSSSLALPIVGEPYGCHALQRLHACTAYPNMLLFPLAFAARLVGSSGTPPWFLLSATGISQSASRRTPDMQLSPHPAFQYSSVGSALSWLALVSLGSGGYVCALRVVGSTAQPVA
jgi:hypothetical protein